MLTNRSAPSPTVVPVLVYADVGHALDWLCRAFGFRERLRAAPDGVIGHAQLALGEGATMLGRRGGPFQPPRGDTVGAYVHAMVDDVYAHYEQATRNGAEDWGARITGGTR